VYVVDNKFDPVNHTTGVVAGSGWHSHPGPSLIFVIAGTVTNYSSADKKCTPHKYSAGQGFIDSGKDVHNLRNEGDVLAETIAVQFLQNGAPSRRIDAAAPGNCPF
jgi:quercetin dioxygenase-like cupin family protein